MLGNWFLFLDELSWDYPVLAILLSLLSGISTGIALAYALLAAMTLIR